MTDNNQLFTVRKDTSPMDFQDGIKLVLYNLKDPGQNKIDRFSANYVLGPKYAKA